MVDDKQWEEAQRIEMKQLERLGVCSSPYQFTYGTKKIQTRAILKKKRSKAGGIGVTSIIRC